MVVVYAQTVAMVFGATRPLSVGEVYDQQHSDTHMTAWLTLKQALADLS